MASVLLWHTSRKDFTLLAPVPTTLPEGEDPRSCLRVSAWLWLMGCRTRELALIRGLYTFNRNTACLIETLLETQEQPPASFQGDCPAVRHHRNTVRLSFGAYQSPWDGNCEGLDRWIYKQPVSTVPLKLWDLSVTCHSTELAPLEPQADVWAYPPHKCHTKEGFQSTVL